MKIALSHIISNIPSRPSKEEISEKLFQLGHEHEVEGDIFNIEFTPNRGDCLSINGILRDLSVFYKVNLNSSIYTKKINNMDLKFDNFEKEACPNISFLKIEVHEKKSEYKDYLSNYFKHLEAKKNNFFTDISNYVSYETGQPTHCYDADKIDNSISLKKISNEYKFTTLTNKCINLNGENLVFLHGNEVINLAGVMGGKNTSCSLDTNSVLIECAFFEPKEVIGKTVKYDLQSEAAHKFERGVDPTLQETALRRFLHIVSEHAEIKSVEILQQNHQSHKSKFLPLDVNIINKIIGISLNEEEYIQILKKLNFITSNKVINIPIYRSDIYSQNDLAEEVARVIGYDEIPQKEISISNRTVSSPRDSNEKSLKNILIDNGFFEVINHPFVSDSQKKSIELDNPLDSNRKFFRLGLKNNLIENLLYNERRQKDIIKLFEISDIYNKNNIFEQKRVMGIICSGRKGKNFQDFSKAINQNYLNEILEDYLPKEHIKIMSISRDDLDTKTKNPIFFLEIDLTNISDENILYKPISRPPNSFVKYKTISEFPSSIRDLSFSLKDFSKTRDLENLIINFESNLLKEIFVFDYFYNSKIEEIKIGFRLIFQAIDKTLTDKSVDSIINNIIEDATKIDGVRVPGLKNECN